MPQQIKDLQLKVAQLERERLAVLYHVDTEKELQAKVSDCLFTRKFSRFIYTTPTPHQRVSHPVPSQALSPSENPLLKIAAGIPSYSCTL